MSVLLNLGTDSITTTNVVMESVQRYDAIILVNSKINVLLKLKIRPKYVTRQEKLFCFEPLFKTISELTKRSKNNFIDISFTFLTVPTDRSVRAAVSDARRCFLISSRRDKIGF